MRMLVCALLLPLVQARGVVAQVIPVRVNVAPVNGAFGVSPGLAGEAGVPLAPAPDIRTDPAVGSGALLPEAFPSGLTQAPGSPLALPPSAISGAGAAARPALDVPGVGGSPFDAPLERRQDPPSETRGPAPSAGFLDAPAALRKQQGEAADPDQDQAFDFRGRQTGIGPLVRAVLASWQNRRDLDELGAVPAADAAVAQGRALADRAYSGEAVVVPARRLLPDAGGLLSGMAARISEVRKGTPPQPLVLRVLERSGGQDLRFVIEQLGPAPRPAAAPLAQGAAMSAAQPRFSPPSPAWSLTSPEFLEYLAQLRAYFFNWWGALGLLNP